MVRSDSCQIYGQTVVKFAVSAVIQGTCMLLEVYRVDSVWAMNRRLRGVDGLPSERSTAIAGGAGLAKAQTYEDNLV